MRITNRDGHYSFLNRFFRIILFNQRFKIKKAFKLIVCREPEKNESEILNRHFEEEKLIFEKDKNNGIFEGELHGDTLIAEYTFTSEGKESIRQVAFLKKGNQLFEGFGDMEDKNGKMMFKNISTLKFGESMVFNKTDCY